MPMVPLLALNESGAKMKRRSFIKLIGLTSASVAVPAIALNNKPEDGHWGRSPLMERLNDFKHINDEFSKNYNRELQRRMKEHPSTTLKYAPKR